MSEYDERRQDLAGPESQSPEEAHNHMAIGVLYEIFGDKVDGHIAEDAELIPSAWKCILYGVSYATALTQIDRLETTRHWCISPHKDSHDIIILDKVSLHAEPGDYQYPDLGRIQRRTTTGYWLTLLPDPESE